MTLTYRAEYPEAAVAAPPVLLLQEWLARREADGPRAAPAAPFRLLPHCTERATAAASLRDWRAAFARHGLDLQVLEAGCCGMAGTFGHEAEHRAMSERLYGLSWAKHVAGTGDGLLATGYSCRSQAKRFGQVTLPHPAQALLLALRTAPPRQAAHSGPGTGLTVGVT